MDDEVLIRLTTSEAQCLEVLLESFKRQRPFTSSTCILAVKISHQIRKAKNGNQDSKH